MIARTLGVASVLGFVLAAGSVRAHHSFAGFDLEHPVVLTGTLTAIDWRNPHVEISIEIKDDQGQLESWRIEGGPPARLRDRGLTRDVMAKTIGQMVTIAAGLAKDGARHGHMRTITLPGRAAIAAQ